MATMRRTLGLLVALLAVPFSVLATPASFSDPSSGLSALIGVAQNGSAMDLYMHMEGPMSAGWAGVAIGEQMAGSLFFVMYPASNGMNTTISVRTAPGEVMPMEVPTIQHRVTNSSVANGMMTADFVCYGCTMWSTGSLDTTSTSANFIYAVGPGAAISSNSESAPIMKHAINGNFMADIAAAQMSAPAADDVSPLLSTNNGTSSPGPANVASDPGQKLYEEHPNMVTAHAVVLALAFYFFMPSAIMLLRAPVSGIQKSAVPLHYSFMMVAWAMVIVGIALGITFSRDSPVAEWRSYSTYHQIIGLVAIPLVIVQAFLGIANHVWFRRSGRPNFIRHIHTWLGRAVWPLGMINAVIGLDLAMDWPAASGMIAALLVIFLITVGVVVWGLVARRRQTRSGLTQEKQFSDTRTTSTDDAVAAN